MERADMSELKEIKKSALGKVIDPIVEPLLEFRCAMRLWAKPAQLVDRIKVGEVNVGTLVGFVFASSILSTLIGKVVPDNTEGLGEVFGLPIITVSLWVFGLVLGGAATCVLLFLPFRWLGGNGSFRHTLIVSVYTAAALFPILTLANGLMWQTAHVPLSSGFGVILTFSYYQQLYSSLHGISRLRTAVAQVLTFIAVIVVTFVVLVAGNWV
jgi:hypothetical protein